MTNDLQNPSTMNVQPEFDYTQVYTPNPNDPLSYDIFARYLPKKKTKKKAVSLKHMPGQHDQRKHGSDKGGGSGSGSGGAVGVVKQAISDYHTEFDPIVAGDSWRSQTAFDAVLVKMGERVQEMNEATQMAMAENPATDSMTGYALLQFGEPRVRETVARRLHEANVKASDLMKQGIFSGEGVDDRPYTKPFDLTSLAWPNSLEYVELQGGITGNKGRPFVESLWQIHGDGRTGLQTAHIQQIMTEVGANATVPRSAIRSFFPGTINPKPNPRYVKMMQEEYERTQRVYAERGITEVELFRSSPYEPGISLEPWTSIKEVAQKFGKTYRSWGMKPVMRKAKIPVKYFHATYETASGWVDANYIGRSEHMVAGLAYAYDTGQLNTSTKSYKSIQPAVPFDTYDPLWRYLPSGNNTRKKLITRAKSRKVKDA